MNSSDKAIAPCEPATDSHSSGKTHFGFSEVDARDKSGLVGEVFSSVADNYDTMNDLMSMGIHRLWKRHFALISGVRPGDRVLDLAGGTGDVADLLYDRVGSNGQIVLSDINPEMLANGHDRMLDEGRVDRISCCLADAQYLPFADNSFNAVTMAFGLRNVTDKQMALDSIYRVLKPGGRALVLEFSKLTLPAIQPVYDWYSFSVLPRLGRWIANDEDAYRYLAESIRQHPDQDTLAAMFAQSGFVQTRFRNLSFGLVAIHSGVKA